ncbi:polyprenol monophosphomannose synthase [Demequina sp. SYSU T00039]|uniref:Polyprenol monophosphomannose synthase n=1 Tax=Demequina lignilytica TaxID=3051663 RepID=A0AAW7M7N8_9MICO|nr:polyprenol monophosphomannose synthase [Demequina sp. SYSU T00039]MDN4486667.1 polyprenol monophosphomannose synthase [Demequina sp. SYSU T00039]
MVSGTLVIIPTYNERESLPRQIAGVLSAAPEVHLLVVDDGSPDGTGAWAEQQEDPRIHVLRRDSKQGLGAAYRAGFAWGLDRGYDLLCEMDADGSHRAVDLPRLLEAAAGDDRPALVIGSRWVTGGSVVNWPRHRHVLSAGANLYVRLALGIGVHDATAGFRVYRADALRGIVLDDVESQGYCFQVDMVWRVLRAGGVVVEVPITFVERDLGASKMSNAIIREALVKVTQWGLAHRASQVVGIVRRR